MTAREDRELENKNNNLENEEQICIVSVTPGPSSHRVLHLDPAQLQQQHLSSSLLALEKKEGEKNQESFCVPLTSHHPQLQ